MPSPLGHGLAGLAIGLAAEPAAVAETSGRRLSSFAAFGTVTETNLMMDRMTGRPRGFGFVTMGSADEAQKAIDGMNGKDMDGRALTVNVAKPREEIGRAHV